MLCLAPYKPNTSRAAADLTRTSKLDARAGKVQRATLPQLLAKDSQQCSLRKTVYLFTHRYDQPQPTSQRLSVFVADLRQVTPCSGNRKAAKRGMQRCAMCYLAFQQPRLHALEVDQSMLHDMHS